MFFYQKYYLSLKHNYNLNNQTLFGGFFYNMIDKIKKIKEIRRSRNNTLIFSQYLADKIDKSISYTDYLSQNLYTDTQTNISYSEYLVEKINP